MGVTIGELTRPRLEVGLREVLRSGGWSAGLWTATCDGREVLVKDVRSSKPLYRWIIGRLLIDHEGSIYERLNGCSSVPRFLGWLDSDAFALEWVPSTNLGKCQPPSPMGEFYDRLRACIDDLHAHGVVHLDLHSRRNVLVTAEGHPMLIDLASALFVGRSWPSRWLLVRLLGCIDHWAILKFRYRDSPELLSRAERVSYRAMRCWRFFWPFGRLWRALGLNHASRRRARALAPAHARGSPGPAGSPAGVGQGRAAMALR